MWTDSSRVGRCRERPGGIGATADVNTDVSTDVNMRLSMGGEWVTGGPSSETDGRKKKRADCCPKTGKCLDQIFLKEGKRA